jgi:hypothetical protein
MIFSIVAWRGVWRVHDERGAVVAVCETRDGAVAYVDGQGGSP